MIKLNDVSKLYERHVAVRNLNLEVHTGEIMGIIGHNGAGKSSTLKMIAGLIAPFSGVVEVMGHDMSENRGTPAVKKKIGFLPEESALYANMTVMEYLTFFGELYELPKKQTLARIEELLTGLNLPERTKLTGELSKGMKRKVAIARVLLHDPDLLILDEPNSGLDPLTAFFILNYLKELRKQGKTILLSAHNLFHVESVCDRVTILKDGRLVICDTMDAIRSTLGHREYEVLFHTSQPLDYPLVDGNYRVRTSDLNELSDLLHQISSEQWHLVNLSVHESALEEIYVKLSTLA
ncbi:MAG: ABC transporter ATP-binding protein [Ardenticatenaceae bacterium]|nr:ABC transporter ATP-binding protein [Ardenticatenaceae bacterium]